MRFILCISLSVIPLYNVCRIIQDYTYEHPLNMSNLYTFAYSTLSRKHSTAFAVNIIKYHSNIQKNNDNNNLYRKY